jgi:hypothetical protein
LFWPLSSGIPHCLELSDVPLWLDLLRDTRDSACFAVVSPRCLSFTCRVNDRLHHRSCSRAPHSRLSTPALWTTVELDPDSTLHMPLSSVGRVKVSAGQLQIQNQDAPTQLAYFKPNSWTSRLNSSRDVVARELLNTSRQSPYTKSLLIIDQP